MRLQNLENRVFVSLLLLTTALFLWVVRGFLAPVFWAAVFAVLFWPVFALIDRRLRGRHGLSALLTTLTVVLVVLVPFAMLLAAVTRQALSLYDRIASGEVDLMAPVGFAERSLPTLARLLDRYGIEIERLRASIESAAVSATQYLAEQALAVGQNALTAAILFVLMLYFLFFFLRDGERITDALVRAIPMGDARERRLFARFAEVSRATVLGTLVVAAVQGTLGGIMFAVTGIQAPVFWGVAMGILSLLPAVGSALVWGPAAIVFFATGELGKGILLVAGGTLVIGLADNLLRPLLIGRGARMPDYLVLLATLGGLAVFGLAGFVAGPVLAALFLVMWEMFTEEYAPLDSSEPPAPQAGPSPAPAPAAAVEDEPARPFTPS